MREREREGEGGRERGRGRGRERERGRERGASSEGRYDVMIIKVMRLNYQFKTQIKNSTTIFRCGLLLRRRLELDRLRFGGKLLAVVF